MWNLEQKTPATRVGEADRRADGAADRVARTWPSASALYNDVQKIFAEHEPIVYFVAPRIYVAHAARVTQPDAGRVPARSCSGGRKRSPSSIDALPRAAPRLRAVPRRRRVVGVAGAGAPGARRLRHRIARDAGASSETIARAARALRPRQVDRARSTATGWRAAVRLDFGYSMQYGRPVRDLIPERAANTAILALTALAARHAHRPAARRRHRQPPRRRAARRDSRGVARPAVDAAAADVAVPRVRRRAHRLAADRRDAIGDGAAEGGALLDLLRHLVVPARGDRAAAGGDARAAAGAGDERGDRRAVRARRRSRAACRGRASSGAAR